MLIFVDRRVPARAKEKLTNYGRVIEFFTGNITYDSISGHPDIFITQYDDEYLVAPNIPDNYKRILIQENVPFNEGEKQVGNRYPETAAYNAVITRTHAIHNFNISDRVLLESCRGKINVHVKQGYTRCNLVLISENAMITSDPGIAATLRKEGMEILFVDPEGILLPGQRHGFIGGACGIHENRLFVTGSLDFHKDGARIREFVRKRNFEIIELYPGPLFDGGSLIFVKTG